MAEMTERERCDRLEAIQGRLMSYYHGHAKNRAETEGEFSRNAPDDMDWLVSEISRLIEAKRGHNSYSSNPAETCVPMTEYLALRSRLESAEREQKEIRAIGHQLACLAYNWSQRPQKILQESDRLTLRRLSDAWDAATAAPRPADSAQSPSNQGETNG